MRPGVLTLPPGMERHCIAGGAALAFRLSAGDGLRVVDDEGGQAAQIAAFGKDGKCDAGLLGAQKHEQSDARGIKQILSQQNEKRYAAALRGCDIGGIRAISAHGDESNPGDEVSFTAAEDGVTAFVAAVGGDMPAFGGVPPTSLTVFVSRANKPQKENGGARLPEPLAQPLQDFRIDKATARAYQVRAGEWIQIIDVQGRQCTDFQVFAEAPLQKGVERCLDVTTSRTLAARAWPQPGLHGKYYDQDFNPLVELVQDSCLRHDAFGLACSAKYYEDMGYPGHINCSDNFNGELKPFGVASRRGWMSMNFFFNTAVCHEQHTVESDEPWSRPGDYVLLRALEDLVCVSSACPDDVDAANGWNPTDIHIRTYAPDLRAKRSIMFRKRTDSEAEMTQDTGFAERTKMRTRQFAEYNGFWLPSGFTNHGAIAEYWACREKAAIMDLSPLRKFEVLGPDAEALLQYCLTRDIRRLSAGQVVYTAMCYDTGTMIDDGTVFRLCDNNFRWIGGTDYGGEWLRNKALEKGMEVRVKSSTSQLHNVAVQGPLSREILSEFVWTPPNQPDIAELGWFRFAVGRLGGEQGAPIVVSRTGYTGELGYEIFCHPKDAVEIWDTAMAAGEPRGMIPLGLDALDMLRVEAGLVFAGYEFDDQTDPFEAGIGFTVPLKSKQDDFIGREALEKRKANPQRVLAGLEIAGNEMAMHGDGVYVNRHRVGVITSSVRSPVLGKNLALCRIAAEHAAVGDKTEVGKLDGHQKRLPATVIPFPFYDPQKTRVRA